MSTPEPDIFTRSVVSCGADTADPADVTDATDAAEAVDAAAKVVAPATSEPLSAQAARASLRRELPVPIDVSWSFSMRV
ncbi:MULTISPECIES: hypothetical protein [Streptosporangium]|uniref:Triacylglycerol esterase/lipase EstA (Alpha/beta hydrolase family) n=1 Tax=Streptosporangium brasiliense TaxID=47480 RepID=A0ABT9RHZ3_9ACTN|nr:hypothetical protein [Streptosporangium brasiliense]MDP9867965.1 triacylglycerol esterase/lipase EstA (alpha/beta hydrolase family) [Streptosporangium brasiliense]